VIIKTTAIPLAYYPYSSTSRIVHWLTRHHGKISTLLKGALRPQSPFLGEYELFSTSELLYSPQKNGTLHKATECALIHSRSAFRTNWKAMLTASYISTLFSKTLPEESPESGIFEFYEKLLDLTEKYGDQNNLLLWAELQCCNHFGHTPNFGNCTLCNSLQKLQFSGSSGGTICQTCATKSHHPTIGTSPDSLALLLRWQKLSDPTIALKTSLSLPQKQQSNNMMNQFISYQFSISPKIRPTLL
jgi:DNA repair protein RecO (recombination protein O)